MSTVDFGDYTVTTTVTPNGQTVQYEWKPGTSGANYEALLQKAEQAIANNIAALALPDPTPGNQTYLGIASPTNAQVVAQVKSLTQQNNALVAQVTALTRQMNAMIRLAQGLLDSTDGT
jgi:hypothetical protein